MANKYFFDGFISEYDSEKKTIKVVFSNQLAESIIGSFCKDGIYSPVFAGGFYIKYTRNTKFFNKTMECTLHDIINNHVHIEVCKINYSYPNRTGWFLKASSISIK